MTSLFNASAVAGGIVYVIVAIEFALILRTTGAIILPAFLFSAFWSLAARPVFIWDFLHAAVWSACILLVFQRRRQLELMSLRWYLIWSVPAASVGCTVYAILTGNRGSELLVYLYIVDCIGVLLIFEQLVRSSSGLVRAIGIAVGALFLFNMYFYASALTMRQFSLELNQARGLAQTAVGLMLCVAPLTALKVENRGRNLGLSRPMAFSTTSLMLGGCILLLVSMIGYMIRVGVGSYSLVIQPLFLFLGALLAGLFLSSSARMARLRIWVDKNFFHTKFEYNHEWRNLSDRLSLAPGEEHFGNIAIGAVLPIYDAKGGACYINDGDEARPIARLHMTEELEAIPLSEHPEFFERMRAHQWIFMREAPYQDLEKWNALVPESLSRLTELDLILPLVSSERLVGFLTIWGMEDEIGRFDWEDLDLLRMVGTQVAGFVENEMLTSQLVVTRQFEAYHQVTAFVMHDLKNLVAQQSLVVENARRFKENPEFVADAISTIENSVEKMKRLLLTIYENTSSNVLEPHVRTVEVKEVLESALTGCAGRLPIPNLHLADPDLLIETDPEILTTALLHLLRNAQDACGADGHVDVRVERLQNRIEIRIVDDGIGMDREFIDTRLFKPFDSTKTNQGVGIGAYQSKQILSKIGGHISVQSEVGRGTCFKIALPVRAGSTA